MSYFLRKLRQGSSFGKKQIFGGGKICFLQAFFANGSATPKTPIALSLLRRLRGVDEPLAVTPNIYATGRLARTQVRLPLAVILL